jgi:16S rRNA (cytosine967-C5)-methyltransferase
VEERDAYANLVMPALLKEHGLADRDAGFATELGYGTLRMQGQHDAILALNVDRPLDSVDPSVVTVLRLGLHQLHQMRVPDHAAVGETVELARAVLGESRASFVNAVLRSVAKKPLEQWLAAISEVSPSDHLAVTYSHPQWIVDAFAEVLPSQEEVEALLKADNEPAGVTLVVRNEKLRDQLKEEGALPGRYSPWALEWSGSLAGLPGLGTPDLGVQDEGSQLVTLAMTRVPVEDEERWLDMCAGPGGKAALLSRIAADRSAKISIVANEISAHRARLVQAVVGENTEVRVGDGREVEGLFDRVLIDAPCSGIGALRRRPEARWRRTARDVGQLRPLQLELLITGLAALKPGGVLAYVTCSPHLAETVGIVQGALRQNPGFKVLPACEFLPEVIGGERGDFLQLWPHRHGTDGMFLALIQRPKQ